MVGRSGPNCRVTEQDPTGGTVVPKKIVELLVVRKISHYKIKTVDKLF